MILKGIVKRGEYFDSVSLMIAANKIRQMRGVTDSAVMMGTAENKAVLKASGFFVEAFQEARDTDLLVAIKAENHDLLDALLDAVDEELDGLRKAVDTGVHFTPKSLEGALKVLPGANLALISLPGKYAAAQAMAALEHGLHVMIFSDNVPIDEEVRLKKYALEKNLLVMGPDCGTAIINGTPLAFANVVKRGNIGVVAASGTGLQEVTSLISNAGGGISQAIGAGGRDVHEEVGGMMFIAALKALARDMATDAILLVARPPHPAVMEKIGAAVQEIEKPVAAVFQGADPRTVKSLGMIYAANLLEGAKIILKRSGIKPVFPDRLDLVRIAGQSARKFNKDQKYLRALFSGGTFCSETQFIFKDLPGVFSNTPVAASTKLVDSGISEKHTILDLGADEFTRGKPHPMIDFSTRNKRILQEAADKETAVILLDLVLGYGANRNPTRDIVPVLKKAREMAIEDGREIVFAGSVTGTDDDPQDRSRVKKNLENAGVIVCGSNTEAAKLCRLIFGG
jgi:succinyl-CoA synthetase alpha subunit